MSNKLVFKGINEVTLDSKGRIAIPAKHRQGLLDYCSGNLVITVDKDKCLLIYPRPAWLKVETPLINLPAMDRQARLIQRLILGYATESDMNSQGRVLLPPPLREFANISKQAILIGQGNKLELWALTHWNDQCNEWIKQENSSKDVITDAVAGIRL